MSEEEEYVLGTDDEEITRLRFQHEAWASEMRQLLEAAGLREGDVALDLGCGPGFTTFELANHVGSTGRVVASDVSERFLAYLRSVAKERRLSWVETRAGAVEELDLEPGSLDAAYERWLLCWLSDPGDVVARVARALRSGGFFAIQDYLDWGAMKMVPASPAFDRAVAACLASWDLAGGTIDIVDLLPSLAHECGLEVESIRHRGVVARSGSMKWRWLRDFFESYVPKLVERDLISQGECRAALDEWARRSASSEAFVVAPVLADVVLRKR